MDSSQARAGLRRPRDRACHASFAPAQEHAAQEHAAQEHAAQERDEQERAIPVLPARCLNRARFFYARLGFFAEGETAADYLVLRAGGVELHFFAWPDLEPARSSALAHMRVPDADALWRRWSRLGIPQDGFPRLTAPADTPWGVRRFALVDPDGNCLSWEQAGR